MSGKPFLVLVVVPLAILTAAEAVAASWPHNSGLNLSLCDPVSTRQDPALVPDGAGGVIVVWEQNSDLYVQHVLASGSVDPAWPSNGRLLSGAAGSQRDPEIVSDGAGGAIITWMDDRVSAFDWDIYAQHVQASGTVDPAWPVDGRALCTAPTSQTFPMITSDGAGGAIVTWEDPRTQSNLDIYAQRVLTSGGVAWTTDGVPLCTALGNQTSPKLVPDDHGGAIVTWQDQRGATSDIYALRVTAFGTLFWPNGTAVCDTVGNQLLPSIVSDGAGGAIIAWEDQRGGSGDIYVQRVVLLGGTPDPGWPDNGRSLCTAAGSQTSPTIASDGGGGAIVAWDDLRGTNRDIYVHHVLASGVRDSLPSTWPFEGRALCTALGTQSLPTIVSDGAGGAIVAWTDFRSSTTSDVYAHHILSTGSVDASPGWTSNGRAVSSAAGDQKFLAIVSDGSKGAILTWEDLRSGQPSCIFAQRVDRFGYLGTTEPAIASVRDVPNDQGGKVKLSWDASYLDSEVSPAVVDHYWIFRSVPPASALQALGRGARVFRSGDPEPRPGESVFVMNVEGTTATYWEYLAQQGALHLIQAYSYLAPTTGDSTGTYNPPTEFMVMALNSTNTQAWPSIPANGYSVDNVPPSQPAAFTAQFFTGSQPARAVEATSPGYTWLHWVPNSEPDFLEYRLYRSTTGSFVPGPENVLIASPDTGFH